MLRRFARRARTYARSARERTRRLAVRAAAALPSRSPATEAGYLEILDGHTLNLRARLPGGTRAELVLSRRGRELRAPAEPSPGGDVVATVLLGAALGGLPVTAGVWTMALEVDGERRYALRAGPPPPRPGPTVAAPPCPSTGVSYTLTRAPSCRLRVAPPRPGAEVVQVRMSPSQVLIVGRFVGLAPGAVTVRFREGGREHPVPGVLDGTRFSAVVPLAELAPDAAERSWNVVADVAGHGALRLGRRLHDLSDPRRVLRVPQRAVAPAAGVLVRVRAHYTGRGDLVLACSRIGASR